MAKIMNSKRIKLFLAVLAFSVMMPPMPDVRAQNHNNVAKTGDLNGGPKGESAVSNLLEDHYTNALRKWGAVVTEPNVHIELLPSNFNTNRDIVVDKADSYGYDTETVRWQKNAEVTLNVVVNNAGLYHLSFDYYVLDQSVLPPEGYIKINDKYPYYEARRIVFNNLWKNDYETERLDRYGNELLPVPEKVHAWQRTYAYDASYFHSQPLKFKLEKGSNRITLVNTRGDLLLGRVYVDSPQELQGYDDYRKNGEKAKEGQGMTVVEAERVSYKNDPSIRSASERDPALTPYDTEKLLLNILDGSSWNKGGQRAEWTFEVKESGYYHIGFKYKQDKKYNLPVFRKIEIDGKVPFREIENYSFRYGKGWQNEILSNGDQPFDFYLTKGKHTMAMTVDLSSMRPVAEEITAILKEINRLTLEIQKLTGNKADRYRDWTVTEYIPELKEKLLAWADRLETRDKELHALYHPNGEIGEVINLKLAVKQLRKLAEEPDDLPNRLNMLSQGSGSVSELLADLLQRISESPLSLDKIYVFRNVELPQPNASFLTKLSEGIKRFFLSFGMQNYSIVAEDKGELQVWVNRPRQYVELMQKMIDEQFTPKTGVRVQLSIMPDENKLILANATGKQPDVALGVNNWLPYELAIRGALLDLRQFADFKEVIGQFSKGAVIPLVFEDGVYALPETQNFWVLFYRKDILESLHIPIPDTWDDVVRILPELQRFGMNFYSPIAQFGGFKPFAATTPFIYQFGGELYSQDGMSTAIDSEQALEGIKWMTDLFTIYNLPQNVPNFYNHFRYGMLPIGISDFQTYTQLRTAAPEIANWWGITLHPGVKRGNQVERWAPAGGQTGIVFKGTSHPQQSWEFLKWWMSTDVQVQFANLLQTTFGETYMWNTANLQAFAQLPWPESDKQVILEQFKWVREASRVPGAYMVERELSNAWNRIVFDGKNPRSAIDDAVIRINREIKRKMAEFGYIKDGKAVKPYPVPTIATIDDWMDGK